MNRSGGAVRRAYRQVSALLPPTAQIQVKRWLLVARRLRAAPSRAVIGVPGGTRRSGPVMLVALDVGEAGLRTALADVAARRERGEAVMLVTDCDAFGLMRADDVVFEYVPPSRQVSELSVGDPERFVARRLASLVATYRPAVVVAAEGSGGLPGIAP
jgi:hypothetical protein